VLLAQSACIPVRRIHKVCVARELTRLLRESDGTSVYDSFVTLRIDAGDFGEDTDREVARLDGAGRKLLEVIGWKVACLR